ncbi:MAG: hypothetical protein ACXAD7_25320 [Candidatus Kariarchaeaceae archaeon]|jgi:hypothetical protein
MSSHRQFTIDTNFFIAGFGSIPSEYDLLHQIFRKNKIQVLIPNYVNNEMRWYMRRIIEPKVIVKEINAKKLAKFELDAQKKVDIKLPQTPDMAVAFLAANEGIPIVSSDLRLVEVAHKMGLEAMMNSAFLVLLLGEIKNRKDQAFLQKLYEKLFADEITYSVKSQGRYDPVVRIQKIMDSALSVVRLQTTSNKTTTLAQIKTEHDFSEYWELREATKEVRTDISDYITLLEEGRYQQLSFELKEASSRLSDLATEVRMLGVGEEDPVYKEALTTIGHILLLASTVAIGAQKLQKAESLVDHLLLILLENDEVEKLLDIEVHLQRITLFFLTGQLTRLKTYFTPAFVELCRKRGREDILILHRTMGILIAVLTNNKAEKTARAKDFSEIQYVIQLGVQFIAVDKIELAWLLLEQAVYMSLNSKMTGLLYAVIEILLPLSFKTGHQLTPSFQEILLKVKAKDKSLPFEDYDRRSKRNEIVVDDILRKRFTTAKSLPALFTGFLDVISTERVDFKRIGRCTFIRAIEWHSMNFIGIVDPSLSLDEHLTVGSSVKILSGKFRIIEPNQTIKENRKVDVLIIGKPENLQFIVRRAGQVEIAQSRVGAYDL